MSQRFLIVTTDEVPGRVVREVHGIVRGSSVRARHLGRDIVASMRNIVGGEMEEYTKLLGEAREQAIDRMTAEAQALGANAIVAARFGSSEIARNSAEMLVYGTAVTLG